VLYRYFAYGFGVSGWATLVILLLGFHGLQFAVLAIIGEYVGVTYVEVKRRPLYLCYRTVNIDAAPEILGPASHAVREQVIPPPATRERNMTCSQEVVPTSDSK
jgi:hypothetical protein